MVVTPLPLPPCDPGRAGDSQWPPPELGPARVAVVLSTSNTTLSVRYYGLWGMKLLVKYLSDPK